MPNMASGETKTQALSVSSAMALAKGALESVTVRIIGEVSELSINPRYKAVYFTIKDASAALPCMMWNNRFTASGVQLQIGALVEIAGRFTLYAAKGRMNFDVSSIQLAGEGRLRMEVAQRAKRLEAEGLMDRARKKSLPLMPERIGIVTSPRGAAIYDVLRTLRRRFPLAEAVVAGVTVEGKDAPIQMIDALHAMEDAQVDVVLLVRGGGSFEDLMPFNDESLARTIAALSVPVVTGIGHEPDTSIADMVSDLRASTPTAAAEAVSPAKGELAARLEALSRRMTASMREQLQEKHRRLDRVQSSSSLADPLSLYAQEAMRLDDLARRLPVAIPSSLERAAQTLRVQRLKLTSYLERACLGQRMLLEANTARLLSIGKGLILPHAQAIARQATALEALSPLSVLGRGYAITRDASGRILKNAADVQVGDEANVQLARGMLSCIVQSIDEVEMTMEVFDGSK